ncbi:hypothetical protein LSAT2_004598 [Lamellibrachia satsuma]|nr:hypothetical protein LSAT2_004598 [Lamellibrachia satsuma]
MEFSWTTAETSKRSHPLQYRWAELFGPKMHRYPGRPTVFEYPEESTGSDASEERKPSEKKDPVCSRMTVHVIAVVALAAVLGCIALALLVALPKNDGRQSAVDSCISSPCQNGGSCTGMADQYTCTCVDGYTGINCETVVISMPVDGQWSDWDAWTKCTKTCGSGTKSRSRLCNDPEPLNGGRSCAGNATATTKCARWSCPDCNKTCSTGNLSDTCSVCECAGSAINGRVVYLDNNTTTLPLADVEVYVVGQEWEVWNTTDRTGRFSVDGLCRSTTKLIFLDNDYMTEVTEYEAPNSSDVIVEMVKKVPPKFLTDPENAVMFVGDTVTFHCNATGVPQPDTYEWLKDGGVINKAGSTLEIRSATLNDSGLYRCQAASTSGKKLSKIAQLQVKEDANDTCDIKPTPLAVTLPAGCYVTVVGKNVTLLDVGKCVSEPCVLRDDKTRGRCCAPVATEDIEVRCDDTTYNMTRVLSCGCGDCEIGIEVDVTGSVVLQAKPYPVQLNAPLGGAIRTSSVAGSPTVTIPANSIVDADGNPYNGPVKVYPTFADPRDLDSISDAPGGFSFQNEEGESQELQTNGVLGLFFEDDNGKPLQLSGKTTLTLESGQSRDRKDGCWESGLLRVDPGC